MIWDSRPLLKVHTEITSSDNLLTPRPPTVTTGRKRRCGYQDLVVVKFSAAVNHYTSVSNPQYERLQPYAVFASVEHVFSCGRHVTAHRPTLALPWLCSLPILTDSQYLQLNVTKLDVLDTFPTIKIATSYLHPDTNEKLESFPADLDLLARVKVEYTEMKGWEKVCSRRLLLDTLD